MWATWSLFAGLFLLLMGGGMIATLIGVRAELDGFADIQIGAIVAAYYAGFLVGSRITLSQLGTSGTSACTPRSHRCWRPRSSPPV